MVHVVNVVWSMYAHIVGFEISKNKYVYTCLFMSFEEILKGGFEIKEVMEVFKEKEFSLKIF